METVAILTYFIVAHQVGGTVQWSGDQLTKPMVEIPSPESDAALKNGLLPNGIYLYGQSPEPEKVQNEYFVFEVRHQQVVGAFYLPQSAFYCFYGMLQSNQLNVTVVDTFEGTSSPYSVDLQQYYKILQISENDRRVLGECQETYKKIHRSSFHFSVFPTALN